MTQVKEEGAVEATLSSPEQEEGTGGQHKYLLQDPALASPQKSTPLFLSIFSDRPGGRG